MNYNFLFGEWNLSVVWSIGWLIEKQKESEDEYYRIGGHADPRAIGQRYGYRCASHLLETSWRFASHWVHSVIAFPWPAWSLHTFSRLPLHPVSSHSLFNSIFPFLFCHFYFIITDSEYMMLGFSRLGYLMFFPGIANYIALRRSEGIIVQKDRSSQWANYLEVHFSGTA